MGVMTVKGKGGRALCQHTLSPLFLFHVYIETDFLILTLCPVIMFASSNQLDIAVVVMF
jgi:hypothetical protein